MKRTEILLCGIALIIVTFSIYVTTKLSSVIPPNKQIDYNIAIHNDTIWVYSGGEFIGKCIDTSWNSPIMKLIMEDNK